MRMLYRVCDNEKIANFIVQIPIFCYLWPIS